MTPTTTPPKADPVCADCGTEIDGEQFNASHRDQETGEWFHGGCSLSHDLGRCQCATCDEDRANR